MIEFISKIKNWFVSENRGIHFSLAYVFFDLVNLKSTLLAFIATTFFIVLMEYFDKYKLKTKFSITDLIYGTLGMIIAYLKFKYLG